MSSILLYASSAIFLLYIIVQISWKLWKRRLAFIPSAPNVPWLGTIPYLGGSDSHAWYNIERKFDQKYNHLYVNWITCVPMVRIGCVEYAEPILKSQEVLSKTFVYDILQEWLGDGLAFSSGKKWKSRRLSLTAAFHFAILNDFMEIFEKYAIHLVNRLQVLSKESDSVEMQHIATLASFDVICETSMGVSVNALTSDSEYVQAVDNTKNLLFKRIANPITLFSKSIYKLTANGKEYYKCLATVHNFTRQIINDNIAARKHSLNSEEVNDEDMAERPYKRKRVLIDVLLDLYEKDEIDIDGIQEEVDTFMFAGHDTTATALSWVLYEIGRNSEIQAKLHEEVDCVSSKDCSLIDKIRSLKYMECVIKEGLRLHPPLPNFGRTLEKDMVINNNVFPSGTIMIIDIFSMHTNPAYWSDPYVFDPSRFEGEEILKRNPYCFVPFSAGPRNCIGQKYAMLEEKVFLYYILSHFNVKSLQTPDEIKIGIAATTSSITGIHLEFSMRS